jgi:hypothetical protein
MRPMKSEDLRADTSAKLVRLELVAALLERDAANNRSFIRNFAPPRTSTQRARWREGFPRTRKAVARVGQAGAGVLRVANAIVRSRVLRSCVRHSALFVVDLAVILACIAAAGVAFSLGVLLLAPPV